MFYSFCFYEYSFIMFLYAFAALLFISQNDTNFVNAHCHHWFQETDVAAAALTITQTRAKFVHFSQPFFHLGLRILVKKPPKWQDMDDLMVVLSPLKPEVWILTLICFLGVSVLLTVIGK